MIRTSLKIARSVDVGVVRAEREPDEHLVAEGNVGELG